MNWHATLGFTSSAILLIFAVPYILTIVHGETRPSSISYVLWTLLGVIDVAAQWSAGASWSILAMIAVTLNTAVFAGLALFGYGYTKHTWGDYLCGFLAILALVVWYVTNNPVLALVFSVVAGVFAAIPTFVKTYKHPESEWAFGWFVATVAAIMGICSTTLWNPANLLAPSYLLFECVTIWVLAFFGQRLAKKK